MSDHDRFIGHLEDYLEAYDGDAPLPTHVRDAIRASLPSTRQVRPVRGPRRFLTMFSGLSAPVRGGLLAAGLVVAVAIGATLLVDTSPGVGGDAPASAAPSTSPTPSVAPSPSASAGATPITLATAVPCYDGAPDASCIAAGTYALNSSTIPGGIVVTVPEGWFPWEPGAGAMALLVDSGPDAPGGSGWGPMIAAVDDVRRDPCAADGAVFDAVDVDTPAEIAAAMATWPGFAVSAPVAITFDGAPGVRIDVGVASELGACASATTRSTPLGTWIDGYPMVSADPAREPATFRILDVGGDLLIIRTPASIGPSPYEIGQGVGPDPERHAADQIEMEAILDSIELSTTDGS